MGKNRSESYPVRLRNLKRKFASNIKLLESNEDIILLEEFILMSNITEEEFIEFSKDLIEQCEKIRVVLLSRLKTNALYNKINSTIAKMEIERIQDFDLLNPKNLINSDDNSEEGEESRPIIKFYKTKSELGE